MKLETISDAEMAGLWCRKWTPPEPAMYTAACGWAAWDGKTATFGRHLAGPAPAPAACDVCAIFVEHWHALKEPTGAELAARGLAAVCRWAAAGFKLATPEVLSQRQATCAACPLYNANARGGLGLCRHGRCGCSRLKPWLASESCPAGKWSA